MNKIQKIYKLTGDVQNFFMVLLLGYMTISILCQVFMRYCFGHALSWPEETARFAQIWLIYIGTSAGIRSHSHIRIETFKVPPIFKVMVKLLVLIFLGYVFYLGLFLVKDFAAYGQKTPATNIPMYLMALCIPVGIGLSIVEYCVDSFFTNLDLDELKIKTKTGQ